MAFDSPLSHSRSIEGPAALNGCVAFSALSREAYISQVILPNAELDEALRRAELKAGRWMQPFRTERHFDVV